MNKVLNFSLKHNPHKDLYLRSGMTVAVSERIKEGEKERVQRFEGLVIALKGTGIDRTVTVRKLASGIGVEKTFVIDSPNVVEIKVIKLAKVRRAKMYYMRERTGKAARLKEQHISEKDYNALVDKYVTPFEIEKDEVATDEAPETDTPEAEASEVPSEKKAEATEEEVPATKEAPAEEKTEVKEEAPSTEEELPKE